MLLTQTYRCVVRQIQSIHAVCPASEFQMTLLGIEGEVPYIHVAFAFDKEWSQPQILSRVIYHYMCIQLVQISSKLYIIVNTKTYFL